MKVLELIILTILLKITNVSSEGICENVKNRQCIELCCKVDQFYSEDYGWCQDLPEFVKSDWSNLRHNWTNNWRVIIAEYGNCSLSPEQLFITKCYAPHYQNDRKDIRALEYYNVPCDRLHVDTATLKYIGMSILMVSPVFLPILLMITWTNKDKKNLLSYKLIGWYLTSIIADNLTLIIWRYTVDEKKSQDWVTLYLFLLYKFLAMSSYFWLSCIGYNAYVQFKNANVQNRERKDRIHFIWYSIFVSGASLTICIVYKILEDNIMNVSTLLISFFNIFAFLVLALKICVIRCRIIGISTEKHIKYKLARIIFRLFLLMGIPRMVLRILNFYSVTGILPGLIVSYLEPYFVYGTFISENENCCTTFRKCCCCSMRHNKESDKPTEEIAMTSSNNV